MATLEKIRSNSKLLIITIFFALLCFVIGDFLNSSSTFFGQQREKIGEVEGNDLSYLKFQDDVEVMTNVFKIQGQNQPEDGDIREMVWNDYVQGAILDNETEEVGLSVTTSELADATLGKNIHPMMRQIPIFYDENNQFNPSILNNVLSNLDNAEEGDESMKDLRDYWLFWEGRIKKQILADKYQALLINAMSAPQAELDYLASISSKSVDFAYTKKPYWALADSSFTVSDSEKQKKYNEMKPQFKSLPTRLMQVVVFPVNPSTADFEATMDAARLCKEDMKSLNGVDLFNYVATESDVAYPSYYVSKNDVDFSLQNFVFSATVDSVMDPLLDGTFYKVAKLVSAPVMRSDSVRVARLVVGGTSYEAAKVTADSLLAVAKSGADFAELVKSHSIDPTFKNMGGDLGWLKEGQSGSFEFDSIAFGGKVGDVAKIESNQGILLVKVLDKTVPVQKVKFAAVAKEVLSSTDTYRDVYDKANQFITSCKPGIDGFNANAQEKGLQYRPLGPLVENQYNLYVLPNGRPVVRWAFEHEVGDLTDKPFELGNQLLVGILSEANDGDFLTLSSSSVSNQVENAVRIDKKSEQLIKEMESISDLATAENVDTIVGATFAQSSIPGLGAEPAVLSKALSMSNGEMSKPIKGESAVYVLKVLDSKESDSSVQVKQKEQDGIRQILSSSLFQTLIDLSEIEDNRSVFY